MSPSSVFDDRSIIGTPPIDGDGVEIAPGIFVPKNLERELQRYAIRFPHIGRAIADMHTVLTEVAPGIVVQRCEVAAWIARMETDPVFCAAMDVLMNRLTGDDVALVSMSSVMLSQPPRRHSVAPFALGFGRDQ